MSTRVSDVVAAIDDAFPGERAEPRDLVGLSVGDPDASVDRVLVTLDPTMAALERAAASGAGVLVTHHPAFLTPPRTVTPRTAPVVWAAAREGIALVAAHTNLDRAPAAATVIPRLLGLEDGEPLEDSLLPVTLVTVYVPAEHEARVASAMADAGAGRIGEYRGCSFASPGEGRFTPAGESSPAVGTPSQPSYAEEIRLEMVAPPNAAARVVRAAHAVHPYEEPLITVTDTRIARGDARMGRLSRLDVETTLERFARVAADVFGITPRVWGDPASTVALVATATGSAGSLVPAAVAHGADVLLAGEVRYHDALTAVESGMAVVEVGHDVSEWPLVEVLAAAVRATPGLSEASVIVEKPSSAWWTPLRST